MSVINLSNIKTKPNFLLFSNLPKSAAIEDACRDKLQSFPKLETEVQNLLFDVLEDYQDMANKHLTAMVEAQRAFINVRYGHYLGDFSSFHFNLLVSIGLILASGRSLYIFL